MKRIKKVIEVMGAENRFEEGFKSVTIPLHQKPIPQEDDDGV